MRSFFQVGYDECAAWIKSRNNRHATYTDCLIAGSTKAHAFKRAATVEGYLKGWNTKAQEHYEPTFEKEEPKQEEPKYEAPRQEEPKYEAPRQEEPKTTIYDRSAIANKARMLRATALSYSKMGNHKAAMSYSKKADELIAKHDLKGWEL